MHRLAALHASVVPWIRVMGRHRVANVNSRLGRRIVIASLLLTGTAYAQPPTQVHVPSFTPASPQAGLGNADDPPPRMGPVTEADCRPQQDALVQAKVEYALRVSSASPTDPEVYRSNLRDAYFRDGGMPQKMVDMGISGTRVRDAIRFHGGRATQAVPSCTEINSCVQALSLLGSRLDSCLWDAALQRAGAPAAPSRAEPAPVPRPAICSEEQLRVIGEGVANVDQRAERFLRSPQGQQGGSATPSLKLAMWTARQQAALIEPCKEDPAYAARIAALDKSHEAARQACIALAGDLGDWAPCGPVSPEELLGESP